MALDGRSVGTSIPVHNDGRGNASDLDLMQDAMVAARDAVTAVAEHIAIASPPLSSLEQGGSQRFCRQAQNVV
jgi:hypothetical protein